MADSGARKIVLADGTELATDEGAGEASGALWCWLHITIPEAAALFTDAERTKLIRFVYGQYMDEFKGFTDMLMVRASQKGADVQLTGKKTSVKIHIPAGKYGGEENGREADAE